MEYNFPYQETINTSIFFMTIHFDLSKSEIKSTSRKFTDIRDIYYKDSFKYKEVNSERIFDPISINLHITMNVVRICIPQTNILKLSIFKYPDDVILVIP